MRAGERGSIAACMAHERAADAPAERARAPPVPTRASVSRIAPRERVADEVVEPDVGVLVAGHAPVDQEDVVALVEQVLDERVPGPQVEDVRPVDQREHEQHRERRGGAACER